MTKREKFINFIEEVMNETDIYAEYHEEDWKDIVSFWEDFKTKKSKNNGMTENGLKVLNWMQENVEAMTNIFTSKEIAEGLFTTGRSVSGSMRKLVNEGLVEKIGKDPVQYALTEAGKTYVVEN